MRWLLASVLVACSLQPTMAQVRPQPGAGNPHIQSVDFKPDQVVLLEVAAGYQTTIELAPDEQIQSVAVGDSTGWQVTPNHSGDHLFIKPLQNAGTTNMTVVTSNRLYAFDLSPLSGPSSNMAYTVTFRYGEPQPAPASADADTAKEPGRYKVSGARALRPTAIDDDGQHTHIEWSPDALLPAIYILDGQGRETLANGAMRDGFYVVDSVNAHLVFRIDSQVARADRQKPRRKRA